MSIKQELSQNLAGDAEQASPLDTVKLVAALAVLLGALVAYYWFADWPQWARVLTMLGGLIAGFALAAFTRVGRAFFGFLGNAQIEMRKVVWPTKQETLQTTLLIFVVVVIVGLLLWLFDTFFAFLMRLAFGH
ncbi:MAG: preprotein translocase subunit SecE [Xanthomonadales bacterium]|jgi:preprotein translocase subunit SecE|nr:preprotein translocase subunit SecE [Xanthomonadales bacterium]